MATSIEEVAMNIRYRVELSEVERGALRAMLSGGTHAARKLKRAQILLAADARVADETVAISLDVGVSTVSRVKRRFVEGGVERALNGEPRPGAARKLTGREEALLGATACASPPEGRARWTLELLAGEMVRLTVDAPRAAVGARGGGGRGRRAGRGPARGAPAGAGAGGRGAAADGVDALPGARPAAIRGRISRTCGT